MGGTVAASDQADVVMLKTAPPMAAAPPAKASFVHGINVNGVRETAAYNSDGAAVLTAGSLGVVYSKRAHSQLVYSGHGAAPVHCFAAAPNGCAAATGDASGAVHIWDPNSAVPISVLPPFHRGPVGGVAFSPMSRYA